MSWNAKLERDVEVPGGKPLKTLADARAYIMKLPKHEQQARYVQDCIEALLMAAEGRGPVFTAHAGVVRMVHGPIKLLNRKKPDRPWMKRKSAARR